MGHTVNDYREERKKMNKIEEKKKQSKGKVGYNRYNESVQNIIFHVSRHRVLLEMDIF